MKVVALNGSPRKEGNTAQSLKIVLAELEKEGIETELIQLGGKKIAGCRACETCFDRKDRHCAVQDDLNPILQKVFDADGLLIGSPTYFSNMTAETKAFIDRCGYVAIANGGLLRRKVGASVVAVRRAGSTFVFSSINLFFGITEMITVGSTYWNMTLALEPGDVQKDEEGVQTFENLGRNMAWLLKKIKE
jgi:multimeric flavodoxin WrbA